MLAATTVTKPHQNFHLMGALLFLGASELATHWGAQEKGSYLHSLALRCGKAMVTSQGNIQTHGTGLVQFGRSIWLATVAMKCLLLEAPWERQSEEEQDLGGFSADCA